MLFDNEKSFQSQENTPHAKVVGFQKNNAFAKNIKVFMNVSHRSRRREKIDMCIYDLGENAIKIWPYNSQSGIADCQ